MGYRTVDEWGSFEFQNADVEAIRKERGHWYLELGYVTILPDNSCNRDIRKMGTNELTLQLQHVQVDEILEEGFKLYDADGNLRRVWTTGCFFPKSTMRGWRIWLEVPCIRSCVRIQEMKHFRISMRSIWMLTIEHILQKYRQNMTWRHGNAL